MCVVSMVHDHFKPRFDFWYPWPGPPDITIRPELVSPILKPDELTKLIEAYKKALEAGALVDKLTAQPDCEDPEKAALKKRVTELEALLKNSSKKKVNKKKIK